MLIHREQFRARTGLTGEDRKTPRRICGQELVKRPALLDIVVACLITVPVSGFLAAVPFFTIRGMMLPRVMP